MATAWDEVAAELLRKAASVDTDVQFRLLALRRQCEDLEATLAYVRELQGARAAAQEARHAAREAQTQETLEVGQSLADAIRRARAIRQELSVSQAASEIGGDDGAAGRSGDKEEEQAPTELNEILETARATRTLLTASEVAAVGTQPPPPKIRLEYPHKMKVVMDQLEELHAQEHVASRRFAFCCKMSEHLSLSLARKQSLMEHQGEMRGSSALDAPVARIQASYPKQVARLRHAYKSLAMFLLVKVEVDSPAFQQVVHAPTLSSAFPIYHRLRQAKKMLRLLNSEVKALAERAPPPPPKLSSVASAHRDAMLAQIRRRKPRAGVGIVDNDVLLASASTTESQLHVDAELLEKLQAAWTEREAAASEAAQPAADMYRTAVREIVLTELSNAVLWSFKTNFAESTEAPDWEQVQAVMRLVRLVDSVALSGGRRYRSVVS